MANDGDTPAVLLQHAKLAANRAKRRGCARCEYYEPAMNAQAARRLITETDLRRALERREFVRYDQPKVELNSKRIVGVEALIRWQHPVRGLVQPDEFIPLLEEARLIV